jgi:hypothetical protein
MPAVAAIMRSARFAHSKPRRDTGSLSIPIAVSPSLLADASIGHRWALPSIRLLSATVRASHEVRRFRSRGVIGPRCELTIYNICNSPAWGPLASRPPPSIPVLSYFRWPFLDPFRTGLPTLSPEQYEALQNSIASIGVLVTILVDEDGPRRRVNDGNHRHRIAIER